MSEHSILMQGIFRDMTSALTLVNVGKLVMQIVTGMEGGNIDTAGLLGHITEEGAEGKRNRAERPQMRGDNQQLFLVPGDNREAHSREQETQSRKSRKHSREQGPLWRHGRGLR
jgi:hypothetical protein